MIRRALEWRGSLVTAMKLRLNWTTFSEHDFLQLNCHTFTYCRHGFGLFNMSAALTDTVRGDGEFKCQMAIIGQPIHFPQSAVPWLYDVFLLGRYTSTPAGLAVLPPHAPPGGRQGGLGGGWLVVG